MRFCVTVSKDFELLSHLSFKAYELMEYLSLKDIAVFSTFVLVHPDMSFKNKFREKLKIKILATDAASIDLTLSESVSLIKSLRNFATEYQLWLKIDFLFAKAIKEGKDEQYLSKSDLMDVLNTFAYREVQNLETWQFLIQKFIDYLIKEEIELRDLISAVISFKSASIKSPELYEMIVNYFTYK